MAPQTSDPKLPALPAGEPRIAYLAKLATFHRTSLVYKNVNGTPLDVAVLVPKKLASSPPADPSRLLVHFHGGALVMGCVLEPAFTSIW
jgi:acetyl esterase/lipase